MARRFNTYNNYNIVGFSNLMQEYIRAVRFKPDGRLVCVDIDEDFVTFFRRCNTGAFLKVCSYSDGVDHICFRIKNFDGEKYSVRFSGNSILLELDKTDPRLQEREEEFEELCGMTWHHITYKAYSETWDHEHCTLCFGCIDPGDGAWVNEIPETARTVYLCEKCMKDFDDKIINKEN